MSRRRNFLDAPTASKARGARGWDGTARLEEAVAADADPWANDPLGPVFCRRP
jgi:hypothetical protein